MPKFIDLTGKIFGRWKVLKYMGKSRWLCECSCEAHTQRIVDGQSLRRGRSQSCGCYNKEIHVEVMRRTMRKPNKYYIDTETHIAHFETNKGEPFIVDEEDVEKVLEYSWSYSTNGYLVTKDKQGHHLALSRYIMNAGDSPLDVDHINRDKSDNRKCNLRMCTRTQNNYNRVSNNFLGIKGVTKRGKKYVAQLAGKCLGAFNTPEEAHEAWKQEPLKRHGEFFREESKQPDKQPF